MLNENIATTTLAKSNDNNAPQTANFKTHTKSIIPKRLHAGNSQLSLLNFLIFSFARIKAEQ